MVELQEVSHGTSLQQFQVDLTNLEQNLKSGQRALVQVVMTKSLDSSQIRELQIAMIADGYHLWQDIQQGQHPGTGYYSLLIPVEGTPALPSSQATIKFIPLFIFALIPLVIFAGFFLYKLPDIMASMTKIFVIGGVVLVAALVLPGLIKSEAKKSKA
jgi:hypothetical protein